MLFSLILALGTLPLIVLTSPLLAPRAGPSGRVISPASGTVISQTYDDNPFGPPENYILQFVYQPVTESTNPGYATQYVDLFVWDQDTDVTTPLAVGLSTPDEEEDAIVSGLITANFTFDIPGAFCGNNFQLVVYEYQTGSDAPLEGFQSAAPSFSVVNCFNYSGSFPSHGTLNGGSGFWKSPTEGATIGLHRDSVAVVYGPDYGEADAESVDFDVQLATSAIDDETSWSTVIHHVSPDDCQGSSDLIHCPLYFSPMHWGLIGDVRLRGTSFIYVGEIGTWYLEYDYLNLTITDTY